MERCMFCEWMAIFGARACQISYQSFLAHVTFSKMSNFCAVWWIFVSLKVYLKINWGIFCTVVRRILIYATVLHEHSASVYNTMVVEGSNDYKLFQLGILPDFG